MEQLSKPERLLAAALGFLAGLVDAVGFLAMGGFFVSFMSGNTTRIGVGAANHGADALVAAILIGVFVIGVVAGTMTAHAAGRRRASAVLGLVTFLLVAATLLNAADVSPGPLYLVAAAMGALNATFERNGDIRFGLTYMTGALVKTGQRIALAFRGGPRFGWLPYLLQWLALAIGAVTGALLHGAFGLNALWLVAGATALFAVATLRLRSHDP